MALAPSDLAYLDAALELAAYGLYTTSPNPRVGSVFVRDGRVLGRGYHVRAGDPHAEIMAMRDAGGAVQGSVCYVSLEPCSHHGRTPPCADALVAAGVSRVVAAHRDPDPRVAGRGFERLRAAGIAVDAIDLPAARDINVGYFTRIERGRPWVRLKVAASLDGRTAMASGESRWITGEAARADVQRWRARSCAILTGLGTVIADDPALTVRDPALASGGAPRQPLRVIADSALRIATTAKVLTGPGAALIATSAAGGRKRDGFIAAGHEVVTFGRDRVDLAALLDELGSRGINELLVEAGATLTGALLQADLWDELLLYLAPKMLGSGARPLATLPLERLADARGGRIVEQSMVGEDLRMRMLRSP